MADDLRRDGVTNFRDEINRLLAESGAPVTEWPDPPPLTAEDIEAVSQRLAVHRASAWLPVSCCVLTDTTGENHCTHEPHVPPPVSRWMRLRWWLQRQRLRFGRWLGSRLAGERLLSQGEWDDEREDDW